MLIDDVTIRVTAGKGGDGVALFARNLMTQGPTGGDGGDGGDVVAVGVTDLGALRYFRNRKVIRAAAGGNGGQNICTGGRGADAELLVPVGTVIHDLTDGGSREIVQRGQRIIVAKGGNGGFGNYHFRSSTNTTPLRANAGIAGQEKEIRLELKLIADVGLIGYPNVGKSSLLNALTNASGKVGNYAFTTLEPNLGVYYDLILADLPGLIEGAAEGRGLGHKFLRHVERTRALLHLVAADSADPLHDYDTVRAELGAYNPALLEKPEWVVVSRADERDVNAVVDIAAALTARNPRVSVLSLLDDASVAALRDGPLREIRATLDAAAREAAAAAETEESAADDATV